MITLFNEKISRRAVLYCKIYTQKKLMVIFLLATPTEMLYQQVK
jgi:hypothetical protein